MELKFLMNYKTNFVISEISPRGILYEMSLARLGYYVSFNRHFSF